MFAGYITGSGIRKLGYSGFAFAFCGLDMHTVHTSDSKICINTEVIDYVRLLIVASKCKPFLFNSSFS